MFVPSSSVADQVRPPRFDLHCSVKASCRFVYTRPSIFSLLNAAGDSCIAIFLFKPAFPIYFFCQLVSSATSQRKNTDLWPPYERRCCLLTCCVSGHLTKCWFQNFYTSSCHDSSLAAKCYIMFTRYLLTVSVCCLVLSSSRTVGSLELPDAHTHLWNVKL